MSPASKNQAMERTHIAEIAAPGDRHMTVEGTTLLVGSTSSQPIPGQ